MKSARSTKKVAKSRAVTTDDLEAMFRGLCIRLDAIGHSINGTNYGQRLAASELYAGNVESIDYHNPNYPRQG